MSIKKAEISSGMAIPFLLETERTAIFRASINSADESVEPPVSGYSKPAGAAQKRFSKFLIAAVIFLLCAAAIFPQAAEKQQAVDEATESSSKNSTRAALSPAQSALRPETLIGLSPKAIIEKIGSPDSLYPLRGESQWQDDVIFYYESNIYFFFYENRVWQIRYDYRFKEKIFGISMGMKKNKVEEILGEPFFSGDDDDIYVNPPKIAKPEKGIPIRLRLIFDKDQKLCDIYFYRGDF